MTRWTVDTPTSLDFDGVVALRVRIGSGSVSVLGTADRPSLDVEKVSGQPLLVSHEAGILTVTYADQGLEGLLGWLRPDERQAVLTVAVPRQCPAQLGVVSASTFIGGIEAKTSVRTVTGNITLDGVTGKVEADTVSGDMEAQGLHGSVGFRSVSGDLTLADGSVDKLAVKTLSGKITADLAPRCGAALRVATLSGGITIRLPADTSARVDLRSATGRVRSDFTGLRTPDRPGVNSLTGTLGDGSGRLSVTTMSGQVTLLERGHNGPPGGDSTETEGNAR